MRRLEITHLSDEELLLSADGELPPKRVSAVRAHLETCWECRTRFTEMQDAIGDFIHVHRERFETGIPPIDGPRALLCAELKQFRSGAPGQADSNFAASILTRAREQAAFRVFQKALGAWRAVAFASALATVTSSPPITGAGMLYRPSGGTARRMP